MRSTQRPEWSELNEDAKSNRKVLRGLRVLALSAAVTLIGAGAIFAQPQEVIVPNTSGSVAVSTVVPPILNFPAVGTFSDDDDFDDFYGFYGFDEDEEDDFDDDDFDDEEDDDDFEDEEDEEDEEDDD